MIVDCAAYSDGARATDHLEIDDVPQWLDKPDAFVWVGLRMPDRDEMARVATAFGLHALDVDAIVAPHRRPVFELVDGAIWLSLRTAEYNDRLERLVLGEICVVFGDRFVITVRYGPASPLDGVRRDVEADPRFLRAGVPAVLARIVERIVDDYGPAIDGFESDVLEVETDVFSGSRSRPTERLYRLRREILELLIVTDGLYDPLERALRANAQFQVPAVHAEFMVVLEQLGRIVARTRILADLLATAIDANMTQVSLQQNEDMRKISAWVAIAAVPTMIAGVYGMNFDTMPELRSPLGYPVVLLVMASVCALLHRAFRRSGWL